MRAPAALALVVFAACASGHGPASIEPHLGWAIASDAAAEVQPRLGVGALTDARPAAARLGQRPPLELGWLGIAREGVERTGDDDFDGPVLEAVRVDLVATLARSGTFAAVESVGFDPKSPAAWPASSAPDYVLTGELEEFVGSQWHSLVVTPFRVGFVRDRFGAAVGRVSVSFELHSRTGLVWQGRVATHHASELRDKADAVLEALARNDEALAAQVDRELRPPALVPRLLPVRVLDACMLGTPGVRRLISKTSEIFVREFEVALVARPEVWSAPREARDLDALLEAVRRVEPPTDGVVLALVPAEQVRDFSFATERTGLAVQLGTHAVAVCPAEGEPRVLTAAHELAHLFGAVHVADPASIMNPTATFDAIFFDPLNRRILREARLRRFGS